jgi:WD40 repeat protein
VAFSPDDRRIVSGSYDRTLKFWDTHTGQETLTLNEGGIVSVIFSPDGKSLFSGSSRILKLWDATKRLEER